MIRRIVVGVLLAGLIGVLVAGAIVRTIDKTGNVAEARGLGQGRGGETVGVAGTESAGNGGGYGQGGGLQRNADGGQGRNAGNLGNSLAPGTGTSLPAGSGNPQAEVEEWLTLEGTVLTVDADALTVQTADGQQVRVENRAWWFAQEQGFATQVGHQLTLTGFYEGDDLEVGQVSDTTLGQSVQIRDESGRPLWAGRGRRGG